MVIQHIVLFGFKDGTSSQQLQDAQQRMLALRDQCVHPDTGKSYVKSIVGGRENSLEGLHNGISHCFVVEFESERDRTYYVKEDPAHAEFKKNIKDSIAKIIVVDFEPGKF